MPILTSKNELANGNHNMRFGLQPSITKALPINTTFELQYEFELFLAQNGIASFFYTNPFTVSFKVFQSL